MDKGFEHAASAFTDNKAAEEVQIAQLATLTVEIAEVMRNADPHTRLVLSNIDNNVLERMAWKAIKHLAPYAC